MTYLCPCSYFLSQSLRERLHYVSLYRQCRRDSLPLRSLFHDRDLIHLPLAVLRASRFALNESGFPFYWQLPGGLHAGQQPPLACSKQ